MFGWYVALPLMEGRVPRKEDYWKDPEKFRKKANEYRVAHPEWHLQSGREWSRKDRLENPEKWSAKARRERESRTPEQRAERAAYQKRWFAENPTYSRDKQAEDHRNSPTKRMVEAAKVRAKRIGVPFDLDWRTIEIPKVCPVLGIDMVAGQKGFCDTAPSFDRLIPALGYVASNVRVISYRANAIKRDATVDELRALVAYMERELG